MTTAVTAPAGRHRTGRSVVELLAANGRTISTPVLPHRQLRTVLEPPPAAVTAGPGVTAAVPVPAPRAWRRTGHEPYARAERTRRRSASELEGPRLYAAASQARRDAADALVAVSAAKARIHGGGPTRRRAARGVDNCATALQRTDTHLQGALDDIDRRRTDLSDAARALGRFRGHGGHLIATRPTTRAAQDRLARATMALDDAQTIARGLVTHLHRLAVEGRVLAREVTVLADTIAAAPPPAFHLVRILLPRSERSNYWRELSSTLAETPQPHRRAHLLAYLAAAPQTVWAGWAVARARQARGARDRDHTRD